MWILLAVATALGAVPTDDSDDDDDAPDLAESEAQPDAAEEAGLRYSNDLSDAELKRRFLEDLPSLGSVSVGLAEAGRLINGVQLQSGPWVEVLDPSAAYGTAETIGYLNAVAAAVGQQVPSAAKLRVGHIGKPEGGYLRPHFSHQSGRDVDVTFYYRPGVDASKLKTDRIAAMDMEANWALVRALAAKADVQVVLLDRKIQKALWQYADRKGEDPALLAALFGSGASSKFQHARRHKDHFHVRFYSPRAQELGRRVQPLLAQRPDENKLVHRVRAGETLGHLAHRYGSSVKMIQKASGLSGTLLSIGRTLVVPLRGPCTQCPVTAAVVVPPRLVKDADEVGLSLGTQDASPNAAAAPTSAPVGAPQLPPADETTAPSAANPSVGPTYGALSDSDRPAQPSAPLERGGSGAPAVGPAAP